MGLDCSYQAMPITSKIIEKASQCPDFSEDIFYPTIAFMKNIENAYYFKEDEFSIVRELFRDYPDIKNLSFNPTSRMQNALIYTLDPKSYLNSNGYKELKETLPYKIIKGESVFSEHLKTTQGLFVRVSSPDFVAKCAVFFKNFDIIELENNFNLDEMDNMNIYKVGLDTNFEAIKKYFLNLSFFYQKVASYGNLSVFVVED